MKRRDFLKAGFITAISGGTAWAGGKKDYFEYNRRVCKSLNDLVDYKTGEAFQLDSFVIAYFTTPYSAYPGGGCENDLLNIAAARKQAERATGRKIKEVLVISPLEEGETDTSFVDAYVTSEGRGNISFIGLTGEKDLTYDVSKEYRAPFDKDAKTKRIKGHGRFAVLISPNGELLAKYSQDKPVDFEEASFEQFSVGNYSSRMGENMTKHINEYNSLNISDPRKECEI